MPDVKYALLESAAGFALFQRKESDEISSKLSEMQKKHCCHLFASLIISMWLDQLIHGLAENPLVHPLIDRPIDQSIANYYGQAGISARAARGRLTTSH